MKSLTDIRADIVAYDAKDRLVLVVEVKSKLGTSGEWAARMLRNFLAHGFVTETRFFLLALPDRFYLWKDVRLPHPGVVNSTYEVDPTPFLQPYYEKSGVSLKDLSGSSFELIVLSFLHELLCSDTLPSTVGQNQEWLIESGLFEAIKGVQLAGEMSA